MGTETTPRGDYIQGEFLAIDDPNGEIVSRNPGDLEQTSLRFPFSFEHVHEAVASARKSFSTWRRTPLPQRQQVIKRYRELMKERGRDLAHAITWEIGKPLWESALEVQETLDLIDYTIENGVPAEMAIPNADRGCRDRFGFCPEV